PLGQRRNLVRGKPRELIPRQLDFPESARLVASIGQPKEAVYVVDAGIDPHAGSFGDRERHRTKNRRQAWRWYHVPHEPRWHEQVKPLRAGEEIADLVFPHVE